jgi:hypothetical protein
LQENYKKLFMDRKHHKGEERKRRRGTKKVKEEYWE